MLGPIAAQAARRFGERPAVVSPDGTLSYVELDRFADELAAGLQHRISPGDRVALVLPSGGDWLVAAVALSRLGAVAAGVSPILTAKERARLVTLVSPRLVLADPDLVSGLPLRTEVAVVPPGSRGEPLAAVADRGSGTVAGNTVGGPLAPEPIRLDPDAPTTICFTSGTTGTPKAAVFGNRQLDAVQRIDLGPGAETIWGGGSPMLASTQFAHVGMALKFPWYLRTGSTLHVMDRWSADAALRLVAGHRMPTIGVVAPQLALMLRSPLMDELDLGCVERIIAGGAASPPDLVRRARERFGAAYSIRYSSTESGSVGLGTAFDAPDSEALHTVGRPRDGVEARVVDEQDDPVANGVIGELQLRSDAVMSGYLHDQAASASAFAPGGWLRTGDLALVDPSGCIVLAGRRSEMYIRGGYNVFPAEVEGVLARHPSVREVVVVPTPDDVLGEVGVAVVVAAEGTPDLGTLREFASAELARHKLPDRLVVVDELPLTNAQKVDRAATRHLVE